MFQPRNRRFSLAGNPSKAAGGLSACLQLLYNGQRPASGRLSEVLGWKQWLQFDPSDTVCFTLWRVRWSFPGGHSKAPDQTSTGTSPCDRACFQSQWKTGCFHSDFSNGPTSCLLAAHTALEMSSQTSRQGVLTHAPFYFREENKSCMLLKFPNEQLAGIQIAW